MTKISNQYSLTNILTADLANSRLGINNVSPTVALDVTGAGKFSSSVTATIGNLSTIIGANSGTWISNSLKSDLGNNSTLPIINGKANSFYNAYTMIYNHIADGSASNFLGLGFYGLDNSFKLNANGAATFQSANAKTNTGNWHQTIYDTSTMAAGVGGGISFCGNKATSTLGLFAAIDGFKENATSANELGGFRIWTSNGTNLVTRLTISSSGAATFSSSVTAGDIFSTDGTRTNFFGVSTGASIGYVGTTTNHPLGFLTNNTERMRIFANGNVAIGSSTDNGNKLQVTGAISASGNINGANIGGSSFSMNFGSSFNFGTGYLKSSTNGITVTTSTTTIYTSTNIGGVLSGNLVVVTGVRSGNGVNFVDLILYMNSGSISVISSQVFGSPPSRSYSVSNENLNLSMASGSYVVACVALIQGYTNP